MSVRISDLQVDNKRDYILSIDCSQARNILHQDTVYLNSTILIVIHLKSDVVNYFMQNTIVRYNNNTCKGSSSTR